MRITDAEEEGMGNPLINILPSGITWLLTRVGLPTFDLIPPVTEDFNIAPSGHIEWLACPFHTRKNRIRLRAGENLLGNDGKTVSQPPNTLKTSEIQE